jgi:uncharacterized protein YbjT (DUF2867 family)
MILLIGATSFLGPSVLENLLDTGQDVKCLTRIRNHRDNPKSTAKNPGGKASFINGDLRSPDSIINALNDVSGIVYLVDLVKTDLLDNFLLAVCRSRVKRIVFISSTTVLLPNQSNAKTSKIRSEELIRKSGLDSTILRPTMIYGVPDDPNFSKMLKFIKKRGFFVTFGQGRNLIQPIYIGDVAKAVADVINNDITHKKTYEIAGQEPIEYNDMLKTVRQASGINFKILRLPIIPAKAFISVLGRLIKKISLTPGQIERMGVDKVYSYKDAERDFGFSSISFEEGIKKLIKKMKEPT